MRSRLLRPELLTDEMLGGQTDGLVLFYVKLWLITDDDGYFEWRPGQIAATLYPYRGSGLRTRQVVGWLTTLIDLDRIELLKCGQHAVIPTIPRHRFKGGNMSFQYHHDHDAEGESEPVRTSPDRGSTYKSPSESESSSLSESESGSAALRPRVRARGGMPTPISETMTAVAGAAARRIEGEKGRR